jgi:hypothetical protein
MDAPNLTRSEEHQEPLHLCRGCERDSHSRNCSRTCAQTVSMLEDSSPTSNAKENGFEIGDTIGAHPSPAA